MHTSPPCRFLLAVVFAAALFPPPSHADPGTQITLGEPPPQLKEGDTIALLGGESVVQEGETGYLESFLAATSPHRQFHVRNLGREGDTVFEQPRDVNFPGVVEQVKHVNATVIVLQFGRYESLAGPAGLDKFVAAYEKLCDALVAQTSRIVLITPWNFEKPANPAFPDMTPHNTDLKLYNDAIADLANRHSFACVKYNSSQATPVTENGSRLNQAGLMGLAEAELIVLSPSDGYLRLVDQVVDSDPAHPIIAFEKHRLAVVEKNRLWSGYARPTNWAFLGGDRMTVASSHDHTNPAIRWFPDEIEQFKPLVDAADARIHELAQAIAKKADDEK